MAKLVVLKSLLDSYYEGMIEKSTTHKYIRRVPKSTGKGYNYFYPEDFKKPFKALLSFFGMKEDKIDNAYTNNNISQAYGVTKQGFAQHVLEYLTNRKTWNAFFSNKANRDKYKVPEKPKSEKETVKVSEKVIEGGKTKEKVSVEVTEKKEGNFKSSWNRSLMRKIYSMYNSVPEDKAESKPGMDSIKVGNSVSYNGDAGKVTKDFENGLVFVKFDKGGMGRFFVKDLQKLEVTNDEAAETAKENASEQDINGTNEAIKETIEEYNDGSIVGSSKEKLGQKVYTKQDMEYWLQYSEEALKNYLEKQKGKSEKNQDKMMIAALEGAIAYKQMPDEKIEDNPYLSVGAEMVKDFSAKIENTRKNYDEKKANALVRDVIIPDMIKVATKTAVETSDTKEDAMAKAAQLVEAIKQNMSENDRNLFLANYNFERMVDTLWKGDEHENRSQAMMGNDNAKKNGFSDVEKQIIALALKKEKDFDPTLSDFAYAEKLREKLPELAAKGYIGANLLKEVENMPINAEEVKAYINGLKQGETAQAPKNAAIDYYVSGEGMWINKYLREPEKFEKENGKISDEEKEIISSLEKETTAAPIADKKLYRAVDASAIFGDISDGDFENLVANVVYGNNERLVANNAAVLISKAENKQITEKGFMSTTKDKEVADNWDGFTGSNKEVLLELNIPEGMTGKDLAAYDVEGEEQKEVLLPRNVDYFVKKVIKDENGKILVQADVLGVHGNHIAMLGNQNARKYGLSEEDEQTYNKEYNWYKDTYVDGTRRNNPYTNEEETIEGILKDEADSRFKSFGENDPAYLAIKDLYIDTTGKAYEPPKAESNANTEAKPQTEKQMEKEIAEVNKARAAHGLKKPGINPDDRVSAMEDEISLNPKSDNYAYKDTGYIAGSQREKIQNTLKRKAELGEVVNIDDLDWNALEENSRTAADMIVKQNVIGKVDYQKLKDNGMDPRAAAMITSIYRSIGKEPVDDTAEGRKNFVWAISTLRERLEQCKTYKEVFAMMKEIGEEKSGRFTTLLQTDEEYAAVDSQIKAIDEKTKEVNKKVQAMYRSSEFSKKRFGGKETTESYWRDFVEKEYPGMEFSIQFGYYRAPYQRLPYIAVEKAKREVLNAQRNELREPAIERIKLKNPMTDAWKQLGKGCFDAFGQPAQSVYDYYNAFMQLGDDPTKFGGWGLSQKAKSYAKYLNWDWAEKTTEKKEKSNVVKKRVKNTFEMKVVPYTERKGGRDISVKSTEELKKAFNLREVQVGSWVQSDPISAKWHTENIAGGFADMSDVLGIPDNKLSLNGRLAIAIGARGHKGALAHYESGERVINITKMKGGGSLGHEWFHAFDNLIAEAINGGDYDQWLTNPNYGRSYKDISRIDATNQRVKDAFGKLVEAMLEGDTPETAIVVYSPETWKKCQDWGNLNTRVPFSISSEMRNPNATKESVISAITDYYDRLKENYNGFDNKFPEKYKKKRQKLLDFAAIHFAEDKDAGEVSYLTGGKVSRFYEDAKTLDTGKSKKYWSTPHEMAARAFEAYLADKLKEKGISNSYLTGHADNAEYKGEWYPYPTEADRVKINKAFDELFEVIRNENAIRKALDILDGKPRFIIKCGRFLIRK